MSTAETAAPRSFNVKRFLADQLRNIAPVFTLIALVVFFSFASNSFLTLDNALNIVRQLSITGIIAVGLTYVILTAEIDLSVAAVANAVGITVAYFTIQPDYVNIANIPLNGAVAIILTLASCLALGAVTAFGVTAIGIPSFIMTLAMMQIANGISAMLIRGQIAYTYPDLVTLLGSGTIFGLKWSIVVCLLFMLAATWISYRDMQTTQKLQYVLVSFQVLVLVFFAVAAIVEAVSGDGFDFQPFDISWFNPFAVSSFSAFAAGLSLSIFIFWGWDVTLTMNEETKDPEKTPGRAATLTVVTIVSLYLLLAVAMIMYAGVGTGELGLGNEGIQENVFFHLSGPILGPLAFLVSLAVLTSSASSLQSTFVGPARTLLSMGHYGALPPAFAKVSPRFFTPGYATIVSAIVASAFYAVMRVVSENTLWDTILTLGMMICFYYGITAFACVWYFRHQWFDSVRNVFFTFLFPLVGGVILLFLFGKTLIDSMSPDYGSGSNIGGLGLVFILGVVVIGLGIVIMIWQAIKRPAFFRGETISLDAPASLRRARR